MKTVSIDIVSDVMCPWCYIGKKRLEKALDAVGDDVITELSWRPFQLDPTLPAEGKDRRRYLEEKFGGAEGARQAYEGIRNAGAAEAIPFDFDAIPVSPNTLDAHRLIKWAGEEGSESQNRLVDILFLNYFTQGANIGDETVLLDAAQAAGMDRSEMQIRLRSDRDRETVQAEIASAQRAGVSGVPCFILDGKYAVMGAQTPEVLEDAIRKVADEKAA